MEISGRKVNIYPRGNTLQCLFVSGHPYLMVTKFGLKFLIIVDILLVVLYYLTSLFIQWTKIGYILLVTHFILHSYTQLINPGTPKLNLMANMCKICHLPNDGGKVTHCFTCGLCVEDHHCSVIGKCLGRKNIYSFYAFIGVTGLLWWYIVLNAWRAFLS